MRVLVFGDSITQGFWAKEAGWVERLRKHYDSLALKDLRDRNNKQPEIFNLGISGDTVSNLLVRVKFETEVRKWRGNPQIVVLAIGTNDDALEKSVTLGGAGNFAKDLQKIIDQIKPQVSDILLVGNVSCDESLTNPASWANVSYTNNQLEMTEKVVSQVAEHNNLRFVPVFDKFKSKVNAGEEILADGLHPNDVGHQLIFELVQPELDKLLNT